MLHYIIFFRWLRSFELCFYWSCLVVYISIWLFCRNLCQCSEFVNNVWCIKILSPQEVQQMGKQGVDLLNSTPVRRLSSSSCDEYVSLQDSRNLSTGITSVGSLDYWTTNTRTLPIFCYTCTRRTLELSSKFKFLVCVVLSIISYFPNIMTFEYQHGLIRRLI